MKPIVPDRVVRGVCSPNCSGTCSVNAFVKDDRIYKLEPAPFPDRRFDRICLKGIAMATERLQSPDRLRTPLRRVGERGGGQWEPVSWDVAMSDIAGRIAGIAAAYGSRANSWISMSGNGGMKAMLSSQRVAAALEGTQFSNLGLMGDLGCCMGLLPVVGRLFSGGDYGDIAESRLIILIAKNVADTAHSEMHFLFDAMEAGAKLVVIDPRFSRTASKADEWISLEPGTDTALLLGMINAITAAGLVDWGYLARHTNAPFLVRTDTGAMLRERDIVDGGGDHYLVWRALGVPGLSAAVEAPLMTGSAAMTLTSGEVIGCRPAFDLLSESWSRYTPEEAGRICGVDAETITALALEYAQTDTAVIHLGQGVQRYQNGHLAFRAAFTLGALCGRIGKAHSGVHWFDGPAIDLIFGLDPASDLISPGGKRATVLPGTRMIDTIAHQNPYPVKSLWISNYGFGTQAPVFDAFVQDALPELDLFVVNELVMTRAARYADYVLPVVSYYEEECDLVGGAEQQYMHLRRRIVPPVGESRSDWDIFGDLCTRLGRGAPWAASAEEVCRDALANSSPSLREIDWDDFAREGIAPVKPTLPHPFADMKFTTPSGRIELYHEQSFGHGEHVLTYLEPLADRDKRDRFPLVMINSHLVHSAHSQHLDLPLIREQLPEPRLDIHPGDATPRQIGHDDVVEVFNELGSFQVRATLTEGVRPGTVNLPQGFGPGRFIAGHHTAVQKITPNPAQDAIIETNWAFFDNLVDVRRAP